MDKAIARYNAESRINIKFGISAGATLIGEKDLKSSVLKRADEALYIVKGKGRGAIEFF
jgi:GGDEF domain-containing protein